MGATGYQATLFTTIQSGCMGVRLCTAHTWVRGVHPSNSAWGGGGAKEEGSEHIRLEELSMQTAEQRSHRRTRPGLGCKHGMQEGEQPVCPMLDVQGVRAATDLQSRP